MPTIKLVCICGKQSLFKGMCKTCYYREYDKKPKRAAWKKAYSSSPARLEYARQHAKTPAGRLAQKKYSKTLRFKQHQKKARMTERSRFNAGSKQASKRQIPWEITFEEYHNFIGTICHYCSGPLGKFGHNLDRKDNALPYNLTNVVPCCGACNRTKGDRLTYKEMIAVSNLLKIMRNPENAL